MLGMLNVKGSSYLYIEGEDPGSKFTVVLAGVSESIMYDFLYGNIISHATLTEIQEANYMKIFDIFANSTQSGYFNGSEKRFKQYAEKNFKLFSIEPSYGAVCQVICEKASICDQFFVPEAFRIELR
ncbi:hypothetical protein EN866_34310 [Mesorhizobium sp. M2D.F.Ca.ET.223.01.1.1]|nr:hypothetical protein EN866_34310 [Mesorhizobium sp. M2D.F.Ca.ET.223.01.1.1]